MWKWTSALVAAALLVAGCSSSSNDSANQTTACDSACLASIDADPVPDDVTVPEPDYTEDPIPDYTDDTAPITPEDTSERVTFRVKGNGRRAGSITYYVDGNIQQVTNAKLPWVKTVVVDEPSFSGFNMNAQNDDGTKISCSIAVDGEVLKTGTSTGPYSVVSCATEDPNYSP